jgi:predicted MFS family arabinose efflux permease
VFCGASLWFAGNAVVDDLRIEMGFGPEAVGWMTSVVQLGFIAGTLASAFLAVADRFSPRLIFLFSCVLGALFNLSILATSSGAVVLVLRFLTGVTLAGIYPVGMKIAAGWYREGLGKAIGFLVGALVVGTALPHLVRALGGSAPWQVVLASISAVTLVGGVMLALWVPDGPYLARGAKLKGNAIRAVFSSPKFRSSAFGYFGHMWELYTLWTFVPILLLRYGAQSGAAGTDLSLWSFFIIGAGGLGCAVGGLLSRRFGSARVAATQLLASGLCCLLLPFVFGLSLPVFLAFLLFWGIVVVGDSPQFSTLNAQTAPPEFVGSGLTIANAIGFAITIPSIEMVNFFSTFIPTEWIFPVLAIGPALGLIALRPLLGRDRAA